MVAAEGPEPIAGEFRTCFDELNFGIPMQDALLNLATRIPSTDLRYFVIAVLIQRETGGNLAELLDNISALIRARLKLLGTVRVLSAEGKLSAWILTLLPMAVALVINVDRSNGAEDGRRRNHHDDGRHLLDAAHHQNPRLTDGMSKKQE
jgi:tight adherence protein B